MSSVLDTLARMRLFDGLSEDELLLLETLVFVNRVRAGEMLCEEGDQSDFVCFVVSGSLDIVKSNVDGGEVVIAHLHAGDSMGEMALVDNEPRSATVRVAEDATLIVLTAFISPFRAERQMVRAMLPEGEFIEVFVDTPLEVAEARDVKGLYKKARAGDLKNFTGIDSEYEPPENPEVTLDTSTMTVEECVDRVISHLKDNQIL